MTRRRALPTVWLPAAGLLAALAFACSDDASEPPASERVAGPPGARPDVVELLREDLEQTRHPSDGAGRAWLEPDPEGRDRVHAGQPGRFTLVYEAGPDGIAEGGAVYLQVSPFWDWSPVQVSSPAMPGYTELSSEAEGVELVPQALEAHLLAIHVRGRALREDERVRIVYGAGDVGAHVDSFAERESPFWIAVDGDGDGVRGMVADPPTVEVLPGPAERLLLVLPSTARPGETVPLAVSVLDRMGSAGVPFAGDITLEMDSPIAAVPGRVVFDGSEGGTRRVPLEVTGDGVLRIRGSGPEGLVAESNPLVASVDGARLLWGDLHGHTSLSDGTGTPEDYFRYARDVAALDVVALTDHDHWGMPFLDATPANWQRIVRAVAEAHAPGRFVALLGYEWTSWIYGHRHVLYFSDRGEVYSFIDPDYETPRQLWDALRGKPALTFAHHSAGGPIATDWSIPPDPELEPVTEVVSVHGSSEAPDSPLGIYAPIHDNYVRDALDRDYRLGLVGSGDSHDGHPGLSQLASGRAGGLAAIFAQERTRAAVLAALRERRVYASSGPRILLDVMLGDAPMGAGMPAPDGPLPLRIVAVAPERIERVDVVRSGRVVGTLDGEGQRRLATQTVLDDLASGDYVYVRVVQADSGFAVSSPFFIE